MVSRFQWVAYQVAFHSVFSAAEVNLCGKGGGPKSLRLLLEGESLLNDASSITLFTIFLSQVGLHLKAPVHLQLAAVLHRRLS